MISMETITRSPEETMAVGEQLAASLRGGEIILLYGDLGAGKTVFAKGLARGLGIKKEVVSPTFTLLQTYVTGKKPIEKMVHVDAYRIEKEEELILVGIEDYLEDSSAVCVIEWPEKIPGLTKGKKTIKISFSHLKDGGRSIAIDA